MGDAANGEPTLFKKSRLLTSQFVQTTTTTPLPYSIISGENGFGRHNDSCPMKMGDRGITVNNDNEVTIYILFVY